jgi:glucokinase
MAALEQNDIAVQRILSELSDDLAFALSHVVQLIHPAVIVMGGGLALVGEPLRAAIANSLPRYVMEVFAPGPPINLARLGEDAVPVGALLMAAATCPLPSGPPAPVHASIGEAGSLSR